jgi:AP2 domain
LKPQSGRMAAERKYKILGICERCQESPAVDRHHVDNDTLNNERENIRFLYRKCHMIEDGRTKKESGVLWHKANKKWMAQVYLRKVGRTSKHQHLGYFDTKEEATAVVKWYKENVLRKEGN